jgi:hypothetical protein
LKTSAFFYLSSARIKNMLKSIVRSPARLIYTVFMVALFAFLLFMPNESTGAAYRSREELYAIVFAFYTLMFVLMAAKGFKDGGNLFSLSDVQFIFTAPFRATRVLFYGMLQQLGNSILLGFFILFQYGWLSNTYHVQPLELLYLMLGYGVVLFSGQLVAMVIYAFSAGEEKKKRIFESICIAVILIFAAYLAYYILQDPTALFPRLISGVNTLFIKLFPVSGWITMIYGGIIGGSLSSVLLGGVLLLLFFGAFTLLIRVSNPDYYEDVLKTAEISFSAITAKKQGTQQEAAPQNVKVGKIGIEQGWGADAFYYKHLIENRRAKTSVVDLTTLLFIGMTILFSFFLKEAGLIPIFAFSVYMQFFSVSVSSRFLKELTKPYIYLTPASSFQKMIGATRESYRKYLIEAILTFIPIGLLLEIDTPIILLAILAKVSFSFLFMAGNILTERIFGGISSKTLIFTFYFLLLALLMAPGLLLAIFLPLLGIIVYSGTVTAFLAMSLANFLCTLLAIFLARNMLQYAELNQQ